MSDLKRPTMYVLAGPNGAGKSTLYETVLRPKLPSVEFINADLIQKKEMNDQTMQGAYKAAAIAEERRQNHLSNKTSFITESTFSHPSKLALIDEAKEANFRVILYHVNVRNSNLSVARVASRVSEGGHNVPEDKIRERYVRNQELIKQAVARSDRAFIYDNSALNKAPSLSISFNRGRVDKLAENVPTWARDLYKDELKPYSQSRQNAAASSYSDIKNIANELGVKNAKVSLPLSLKDHFKGEIVGESALHVLQKKENRTNEFVAHFKASLGDSAIVGKNLDIKYQSRYKAEIKPNITDKNIANKIDMLDKHLTNKGLDTASRNKLIDTINQKLQKQPIEIKQPSKDKNYDRER